MRSSRILIIDDNEHQHKILSVYARTLPECEYEFKSSLESAIDALKANMPDLILLDSRLAPYTNFTETAPEPVSYTHLTLPTTSRV